MSIKLILGNCLKALATLAVCAGFLTACDDDDIVNLSLYYPSVVDIGPSMNFTSGAPSFHGATPSDFAIDKVTLDGETITTSAFTIAPATGIVTIAETGEMSDGLYKLTISCMAGGHKYTFADVLEVKMSPVTPAELTLSAPSIAVPYDEFESSDASVKVEAAGESVTIISYGLVQDEGKEFFAIDGDGVVKANPNFKGTLVPGDYPLPIKISTYGGEAIYRGLLTGRITSAPLSLTYTGNNAGRMETGMEFRSAEPVMSGSPTQVAYTLRAVNPIDDSPATNDIKIDQTTGAITVAAGSTLPIGASYSLDVTVANEFGQTDFDGAYTLSVIGYIEPIEPSTFAYADTKVIQAGAFSITPAEGLKGGELTFSFGNIAQELQGQLNINPTTGEITAAKGNTIPMGTHAVEVKVVNIKSEATARFNITVEENPYYFTTIRYGNNLDLTPAENYANQFRCYTADAMKALTLVPTTDAKPGTELYWTVRIVHQCKGTTIDSETGAISMSGFQKNNGGLLLVTATAGAGTAGETSVTVPVFFSFLEETVSGLQLSYTPFVMQVNPRRGGDFNAPAIAGVDPGKFLMDYRRTFAYYNFNGPASHNTGALSASNNKGLLGDVWRAYFAGQTVNYGARKPLSYYDNTANLTKPAMYIDPATKAIHVNPNRWVDASNVAANGFFIGQATFVTNGDAAGVASGSQIFPLWLWFDENF